MEDSEILGRQEKRLRKRQSMGGDLREEHNVLMHKEAQVGEVREDD